MPTRLEYGLNVVIPIEYNMTSSRIAAPIDMTARGALEEGIVQLEGLKEECLGPDEEM